MAGDGEDEHGSYVFWPLQRLLAVIVWSVLRSICLQAYEDLSSAYYSGLDAQ